jgi:hypothetical protein
MGIFLLQNLIALQKIISWEMVEDGDEMWQENFEVVN